MQQEQLVLPSGVVVRGSAGERYVIEGLLGKGEMGAVYLVKDREIEGKFFALKEVINPSKDDGERFVFEGDVLKRLNHRALPRVYRLFENDKLKRVYILMDYINGRNLEDLRREQPGGYFSLPLVVSLMFPIVDALIYLHTQNPPIVHRDVKPANVIVPAGAEKAVLVDFGSAKEYIPTGMLTVAARRTPGYAAPEQYGSGTSPRTDIYGLSATLYTLLTGVIPPAAVSRFSKISRHGIDPLRSADELNPAVPAPVAQALQRGMSVSSSDRFETVEELWQVVTSHAEPQSHKVQLPQIPSTEVPLLLQETETSEPESSPTETHRKRSMWQGPFIVILITLLIAALLLVGVIFHLAMAR